MPETREGDDAIELVRKRVMRGFSVEFIPDSHRMEDNVVVIEKAKLRNIGLVDRPAYPASRVNPRSEDAMNEAEIRKLIEDALKARDGDGGKVDVDALVRAVAEGSKATIDTAVKERGRRGHQGARRGSRGGRAGEAEGQGRRGDDGEEEEGRRGDDGEKGRGPGRAPDDGDAVAAGRFHGPGRVEP